MREAPSAKTALQIRVSREMTVERKRLRTTARGADFTFAARAAAAGLRAPVQVMDGNYKLLSGTCPWWDGMK